MYLVDKTGMLAVFSFILNCNYEGALLFIIKYSGRKKIDKNYICPLQCSCLENPRDEGAW